MKKKRILFLFATSSIFLLAVTVDPDRLAIIRNGTEVGHVPLSNVRRYSFAIVPDPKKLYVPTEGETRLTLCKAGDLIPDDQGGTCPSTGVGLPNNLTLFDNNGNLRSEPGITKVLEFAEGAYVEGVIRFEAVPAPSRVVARRPLSRAP